MNKGIGKEKLGVCTNPATGTVAITEFVKRGRIAGQPTQGYRATLTGQLSKKQALALGLLLIKAAQS